MKNRKILYAVNFQEDEDGYSVCSGDLFADFKRKNNENASAGNHTAYPVPHASKLKFRDFILSATEKVNTLRRK